MEPNYYGDQSRYQRITLSEHERLVAKAVAETIERCALVCKEIFESDHYSAGAYACYEAIRALKGK